MNSFLFHEFGEIRENKTDAKVLSCYQTCFNTILVDEEQIKNDESPQPTNH